MSVGSLLRRSLLGLLCLIALPLSAFDPKQDVRLNLTAGRLVVQCPSGVHLKARFMSVALKPGLPGRLVVGAMTPPQGKDALGEAVWEGPVTIPLSGEGLSGEVELLVKYQACVEQEGGMCFPPTTQTLKVAASAIPTVGGRDSGAAPSRREGLWGLLLMAFGAGLAASLTPCVYPMIPITMAVIGARGGSRLQGLTRSLVLVLGMAVTYTTLGVVAARTGATFGAFAQKPAFLVPFAVIFVLLALSLLGMFELQLPDALQNRLQGGTGRKGWFGAFLAGLVLGPLAAPCVGPVVGSVLLSIAQRGDTFLGGLQLFVFALGMGVLFLVAGTFSAALPRSGAWLERLKKIMGVVVLGFAVWTLRLILPSWANLVAWAAVAWVGMSVFGAFEPAGSMGGHLRKGFALFLLGVSLLLGLRGLEGALHLELLPRPGSAQAAAKAPESPWLEHDLEQALARAREERKLVLVDAFTDWCAMCKELDEKTWPDAQVQQWIQRHAVPVRIDMEKHRPDLATRFAVQSFPSVLLLDAEGRERTRILGFHAPDAMLRLLGNGGAEALRP